MFYWQGVVDVLCESCERLGWTVPSKIQHEAIPIALSGRDIIGLAETGSGKTAAFLIPILQSLLSRQQRLFALILTPTRELAVQIQQQVEGIGTSMGVQCGKFSAVDKCRFGNFLWKKIHPCFPSTYMTDCGSFYSKGFY